MQKGFLGGRRREEHQTIVHPINFPKTLALESILVKRCMCTGEGPELGQMWAQVQTKQDDWPEEAWKNCPHTSDLNDLQSMCYPLPLLLFLSLSVSLPAARPPACLCFLHTYILSLSLFCLFMASATAYRGSQARGRIGAMAASLHNSPRNARPLTL